MVKGMYTIENAMYEINPAIPPIVILSGTDSSLKTFSFIKKSITIAEVRHISTKKANPPTYGSNAINPHITPRKQLSIDITFNKDPFIILSLYWVQCNFITNIVMFHDIISI